MKTKINEDFFGGIKSRGAFIVETNTAALWMHHTAQYTYSNMEAAL